MADTANVSRQSAGQEQTEIDLLQILYGVRRNWIALVLAMVIFGGLFGAYNYFFVTQLYSSTATIFILNTDTVVSLTDLQLSDKINGDYQLIIKGRAVANRVIENLELKMNYRQLQKMISVSNPSGTHALEITVKTSSADAAIAIVNEVMNVSIEEIHNVLDTTEPSVMDVGAAETVVKVDKGLLKYTMIGALLGAMLVVAIVAIKIIMDNTIKDEDDVEQHLGIATLSSIPYYEVTDVASKNKDVSFAREPGKKYVLPIVQEVNYDTNEAISTLRTNMLLSGYGKKVFMFTSMVPNEGKSFITYQLSRNIAEMKKKVVFLDCDIRNSVIRKKMGLKKKVSGVTEYLCGQAELADVVYGTDSETFDIIFTGATAPNPTDLFESERFEKLIQELRGLYDYVIIDTAPLGMVIDAAVIAKKSDGAIIVLEAGKDDYRNALHMKKQLEVTDVDIIGAVLNKINIGKNIYGYGYGYGRYGYGKYGYGKYGKYGKYGGYGYGYGPKNEKEDAKNSKAKKPAIDTKKTDAADTKKPTEVKKTPVADSGKTYAETKKIAPATVRKPADEVKKSVDAVRPPARTDMKDSDK
ncbi:MAG: polysaccharide biosynthesis tyrosine autokinase [Lachnospiraceae bacterium]|nr:polysaccharide biosynthesis tyrosine autokinase [Lachnospiraceae bacterium]